MLKCKIDISRLLGKVTFFPQGKAKHNLLFFGGGGGHCVYKDIKLNEYIIYIFMQFSSYNVSNKNPCTHMKLQDHN